jgi:hypothetical protein
MSFWVGTLIVYKYCYHRPSRAYVGSLFRFFRNQTKAHDIKYPPRIIRQVDILTIKSINIHVFNFAI